MKHFPENGIHLRKKSQNYSRALSSLLPTLVCKKAEVNSVPELLLREKGEIARVGNLHVAPITSNISKKILSRRSNNALDRTTSRMEAVSSQRPKLKPRVNQTIACTNPPSMLDDSIGAIKPSSKLKKFRVKKLDQKYLRCPLPEMFSNHTRIGNGVNNIFSQRLFKQAVPTQVLYFNSEASAQSGVAVLNISNFHVVSHCWKQSSSQTLSDEFKRILQNLSQNFSVVIKSEQMGEKVEQILSEIASNNIEILAWIDVQKCHSGSNKLYNLSDFLKVIGTLSSIWIFEETSATPRDLNKEVMLPVFKQVANVNLVLYKKQDKADLARMNPQQLQKLKRVDSKEVISFKEQEFKKIASVPSLHPSCLSTPAESYDVGDFKSKLIQYLKILKAEKKTCSTNSVNYLVGDLVKRNFAIFQNLLNNAQDSDEELSPAGYGDEKREQLRYDIEILSF